VSASVTDSGDRINGLGSSESGSLARGLPTINGEGLLRIAPKENLTIIVDGCRFAEVGEMGIINFAVAHFDVGITNSAPFEVLSGQRCMIDFCRV
jgi:hypothetical protein